MSTFVPQGNQNPTQPKPTTPQPAKEPPPPTDEFNDEGGTGNGLGGW